jgi:hypothetical protein
VRKCEKPRYTLLKTIGQRRGWFGKVAPAAEVSIASEPGQQPKQPGIQEASTRATRRVG